MHQQGYACAFFLSLTLFFCCVSGSRPIYSAATVKARVTRPAGASLKSKTKRLAALASVVGGAGGIALLALLYRNHHLKKRQLTPLHAAVNTTQDETPPLTQHSSGADMAREREGLPSPLGGAGNVAPEREAAARPPCGSPESGGPWRAPYESNDDYLKTLKNRVLFWNRPGMCYTASVADGKWVCPLCFEALDEASPVCVACYSWRCTDCNAMHPRSDFCCTEGCFKKGSYSSVCPFCRYPIITGIMVCTQCREDISSRPFQEIIGSAQHVNPAARWKCHTCGYQNQATDENCRHRAFIPKRELDCSAARGMTGVLPVEELVQNLRRPDIKSVNITYQSYQKIAVTGDGYCGFRAATGMFQDPADEVKPQLDLLVESIKGSGGYEALFLRSSLWLTNDDVKALAQALKRPIVLIARHSHHECYVTNICQPEGAGVHSPEVILLLHEDQHISRLLTKPSYERFSIAQDAENTKAVPTPERMRVENWTESARRKHVSVSE